MSHYFIGHPGDSSGLSQPGRSLWLAGRLAGATWSGVASLMSGSRLAGWRIFAPCGRLILSRLAGLLHAVVSGFQSAARERAPVGLHFSSLWVMFALVLLANPESVWGGTTQGYECREVGTNRGYHCTIYQGVEFVHICYLVSVPTFCLSLRLATRGDRIEKS